MFIFLTAMGWWRHASHRSIAGRSVPFPGRWTFLSGLATAAVIATTTLAYSFEGVSIVFVMLLMRGGVLVLAPLVDAVSQRSVRWFSWVGLALSLSAVLVAFAEEGGYAITLVCAIDVAIYLVSYFVRLRFMSRLAKSEQRDKNVRFFVEEQMVATPALLLVLALGAVWGEGALLGALREGFTGFWGKGAVVAAVVVGLLSQGTGIFGGLVLLDARENTYSVPVNRCSSVLAGVLASYGLSFWLGHAPPSAYELGGAALIVAAILVLTLPMVHERHARSLVTGPENPRAPSSSPTSRR
jgi:hypothetical protein